MGKRKLVYLLLVHLFACFVRVSFCPFSLPLGVKGGLRFVIVPLPGLFYYVLCYQTVLRRGAGVILIFVWLCGVYYGEFHVESCLALCSRVFSVLFSIVITSLEEERAGLCVSRVMLVYFLCVKLCPFSLLSVVRGWIRLVLVALPELSINFALKT